MERVIERIVNKSICEYLKLTRTFYIKKRDKKICGLHEEWNEIEKSKLNMIRGNNQYAYKIYINMHGGDIKYFVSDDLYQNILLPRLNFTDYQKDGRYCGGHVYFSDKNYQNCFMGELKFPKCILHNVNGIFYNEYFEMIPKDKVIPILSEYEKLVCKKSMGTGHGKGIQVIGEKDFGGILEEKDFIIQEILKQHKSLACYNESSVNIIRITSLFWKGEIYILGGVLRVGAPGAFCDHLGNGEKNPLVIAISEDGKLGNKAIDCDAGYIYEDVWGKKIKGSILKYEDMKELIKKAHQKYPKHGIIGWDLTLDEDAEIRCIEYNVGCPGIMQAQYALGSIFGKKTVDGNVLLDEILEEDT